MAISKDTIVVESKFQVAKETQAQINTWQKYIGTLKKENKNLQSSRAELVATGRKDTEAYRQYSAAIKANEDSVREYTKKIHEAEKAMGLQYLTMGQLKTRLKDLATEMKGVSKTLEPERWNELNREVKETENRIQSLSGRQKEFQIISGKTMTLANLFSTGLSKLFSFLVTSIKTAIDKVIDFEQANANLAAVLGTDIAGVKDLTSEALKLGKTTEWSAAQVTSLQTELAKLGFTAAQIKQMTEPVLNFATATGADLPRAAALGGAALRMFGLEADQTERVVSAMAVGTDRTALSFDYLETAMSTVGPVAKSFGFTIEDTVALLGTLSNAGFDASSAATATRNILLNMADAGGKLATALGRPVKSIENLAPALQELQDRGISLADALELTDRRSVAAFNTFLENADTLTPLKDSITDVSDELKTMTETRLNTVQGSMKLLSAAWESILLKMYESKGIFKSAIDALTALLTWTGNNTRAVWLAISAIAAYITAKKTVRVLEGQHIESIKDLIRAIQAKITATKADKAATEAAAVATRGFGKALMGLALFAIIEGLILLAGWLIKVAKASRQVVVS